MWRHRRSSWKFKSVTCLVASEQYLETKPSLQLQDAKAQLAEARKASGSNSSSMLKRTREFKQQQESVNRRLAIVTDSDTPEEAVQRLKAPMEKLRRVELARAYVELLKDVDSLAKDARRHLPSDPKEALKPYNQLKHLTIDLQKLQEPAEGAAVHLVTYVDGIASRLWVEMKKIMSDEFESVLKTANWPENASQPNRDWSDCFGKMLDLQGPEIVDAKEPLVLLPMSVLVKPFVKKFRYHFMTETPTNHPHQVRTMASIVDVVLTSHS